MRSGQGDDFDPWLALYEAVAAEPLSMGAEAPLDPVARREFVDRSLTSDDAATFLAEDDGRLIGAVNLTLWNGVVDLGMFVAGERRGGGVGSASRAGLPRRPQVGRSGTWTDRNGVVNPGQEFDRPARHHDRPAPHRARRPHLGRVCARHDPDRRRSLDGRHPGPRQAPGTTLPGREGRPPVPMRTPCCSPPARPTP
jgi:hypothetical protein